MAINRKKVEIASPEKWNVPVVRWNDLKTQNWDQRYVMP